MNQDAVLGRAARLASEGQYEESLRLYESACEAAPRDERALCGKALALMLAERQLEAAECMQDVIDGFPEASYPYGVIGFIMEEDGDLDAALICYESMIMMNPSEASAYVRRAQIFQDAGYEEECDWEMRECAEACNIDWESPRAAERLEDMMGRVLADASPGFRTSDSAAFMPGLRGLLDRAVGDGLPASEDMDLDALALAGSAERAEAISTFDRALAEHPDSTEMLYVKCMLLSDEGRAAEAMACCERIIKTRPGSMLGYERKLVLLQDAGDRQGIIECLDAALAAAPESADEAGLQEGLRAWRGTLEGGGRAKFSAFSSSSAVEWHLARRRERAAGGPSETKESGGRAEPGGRL